MEEETPAKKDNGGGAQPPRVAIALAIIGLLGTLGAAWIAHRKSDEVSKEKAAIRWVVRVFEVKTNEGIVGARVKGVADRGFALEGYTGQSGAYIFTLEPSLLHQSVPLSVTADGYLAWHDQVFISDVSPTDAHLTKRDTQVVTVSTTPPKPTTSSTIPTSTPTTTTTAATSTPTGTTLPGIEKLFNSGPKPSGTGRDFSPPYRLCAEPPPPSYIVTEAQFYLSGDRQCGAWSTCTQVVESEREVCWVFTLQGHDECQGPFANCEATRNSEGHLRVVYKPAASP